MTPRQPIPRKSTRVTRNLPVLVRVAPGLGGGAQYSGQLTDVSSTGARIVFDSRVDNSIGAGSEAILVLEAARPGPELEVHGWVVRAVRLEEDSREIVVCFHRPRFDILSMLSPNRNITVYLSP